MWWKTYFWVYLVLSVIGMFSLLRYAPFGIVDILGILLSVVLLLSVYSYIFKKKVLHKKHWKIIFWVVIALLGEELIELYVLPANFITDLFPFLTSSVPVSPGERLFSWFISAPGIYAIYKLTLK